MGKWRESYGDGKPVEDTAVAHDNRPINGIDGLTGYLQSQEPQVIRNMSHKLIGYALGRTVLASDQPLVDRMVAAGGEAGFSKLVTEIITSPQFRYRRGVEPAELAKDTKR